MVMAGGCTYGSVVAGLRVQHVRYVVRMDVGRHGDGRADRMMDELLDQHQTRHGHDDFEVQHDCTRASNAASRASDTC